MKLLALIVSVCLAHQAAALSFALKGDTTKCLQEDVEKDVLVVGDYSITRNDNVELTLEISDSRGHPVYRKEDASSGKFAFTSDDYDVFEICFNSEVTGNNGNTDVEVKLAVKLGAEARSYQELGKAEKLKPMELSLRKLEDISDAIMRSFNHMQTFETQHRDTNELTAERMLQFSIFSMVCLLVLAIVQVFYLRNYFQKKKLI